jgi:hypothetical protein
VDVGFNYPFQVDYILLGLLVVMTKIEFGSCPLRLFESAESR